MPDKTNPTRPRNMVVPTVAKNLLSTKRFRVVTSVFSGEGRTKSELKCMAQNFPNGQHKDYRGEAHILFTGKRNFHQVFFLQ